MIIHSKLEFSTYIRKAQYRNLHMFFRSTRIEVLFEEKEMERRLDSFLTTVRYR